MTTFSEDTTVLYQLPPDCSDTVLRVNTGNAFASCGAKAESRGFSVQEAAAKAVFTTDAVGDTTAAAQFGSDTALRCLLALMIVRISMRGVVLGAQLLSAAHPSRRAYSSAVYAWRDRTRLVPWRGFIPTDGRVISPTQFAWLVVAALFVQIVLHVFGLPHLPVPGLDARLGHLDLGWSSSAS